MIHCPEHSVVTPSRVHAVAIAEGHVDLLRGSCGFCGQTVVCMDTGNGLVIEWFAVADIVRRERHYQRQLLTDKLLEPHGSYRCP